MISTEITPRNAALQDMYIALLKSKWQVKEGRCGAIRDFVTRVLSGHLMTIKSSFENKLLSLGMLNFKEKNNLKRFVRTTYQITNKLLAIIHNNNKKRSLKHT